MTSRTRLPLVLVAGVWSSGAARTCRRRAPPPCPAAPGHGVHRRVGRPTVALAARSDRRATSRRAEQEFAHGQSELEAGTSGRGARALRSRGRRACWPRPAAPAASRGCRPSSIGCSIASARSISSRFARATASRRRDPSRRSSTQLLADAAETAGSRRRRTEETVAADLAQDAARPADPDQRQGARLRRAVPGQPARFHEQTASTRGCSTSR